MGRKPSNKLTVEQNLKLWYKYAVNLQNFYRTIIPTMEYYIEFCVLYVLFSELKVG